MRRKKFKNTMKLLISIMVAGIVVFMGVSAFSREDGVIRKIKEAKQGLDPKTMVQASIPVPRNIVKANVPYQGGDFYIDGRKDQISKFKCSSCHVSEEKKAKNTPKTFHEDIAIQHGGKEGPSACYTCHSKEDRNSLINVNREKIDIDHSYDMCGQCHFRQKKDWIGGAHGQRIEYWAGERVIKNCTSCHNPHSPKFEKQWPATYSVPLKK
jgi:hypothetical protein